MKAMYIGKDEYYNKTNCKPVFLTYGDVYNIIVLPWGYKWKYLVAFENIKKGILNWIPYNVNPMGKYWQKL